MLDFSQHGLYVVVEDAEAEVVEEEFTEFLFQSADEEDNDEGKKGEDAEQKRNCEHSERRRGRQQREGPKKDEKTLVAMIVLVGFFAVCEWIGGAWSGSLALMSDAFHMMSDFVALFVGFFALRLALKEKTKQKSYGWQRAGVLGALMNGVFLMSACLFLVTDAIARLVLGPEEIEEPWVVFGVGIAGLLVNLLGLLMFCSHRHLHSHAHSHSHGHGHSHSHRKEDSGGSMNMHGVFLHVLGDALGSVVVIGVAILNVIFADKEEGGQWVTYVDPICSMLLALFLIKTAFPLIRSAIHILMQSVPSSIDASKIEADILLVDGVSALHSLHIWQLDEQKIVGSVHVECCCEEGMFGEICKEIKMIMHRHDVHNSTVQPEFCLPSLPPPTHWDIFEPREGYCVDEEWCR